MYTLKLTHHFDSSHYLKEYKGKCANVHGHRWVVNIEITTSNLKNDMIVDFSQLKNIIDILDHKSLNDVVIFNPTAENLSKYLFDKILEETGFHSKITLFESPEASITYEQTY